MACVIDMASSWLGQCEPAGRVFMFSLETPSDDVISQGLEQHSAAGRQEYLASFGTEQRRAELLNLGCSWSFVSVSACTHLKSCRGRSTSAYLGEIEDEGSKVLSRESE